jgi:hypothetical protein
VVFSQFASARDRLPKSRFVECCAIFGVERARSVHKAYYGHNRDWAAAQPLLPEALKPEIVAASF